VRVPTANKKSSDKIATLKSDLAAFSRGVISSETRNADRSERPALH
jgi:hypothetical protein